jgi:hypothetical protein
MGNPDDPAQPSGERAWEATLTIGGEPMTSSRSRSRSAGDRLTVLLLDKLAV